MRNRFTSADYHIGYRFCILAAVCKGNALPGRNDGLYCQRGNGRFIRLALGSRCFQYGDTAVYLTVQSCCRNGIRCTCRQIVCRICSGPGADLMSGADYLLGSRNSGSCLHDLPCYCLRIYRCQCEVNGCLAGLNERYRDFRFYSSGTLLTRE